MTDPCPLCGRPMIPGPSVSEHHLIPKSKDGKIKDLCHVICHRMIHATWDENQLRDTYNTWVKLREAPEMQGFIRWVRKQPADHVESSKLRRGHRRRR